MERRYLAEKIVKTLQERGFKAYFAGGFVRDLLLELPSDDIDIATNATPLEVKALFPKTIEVGVEFGVIVVVLAPHSFEVATFRSDSHYTDGRHPDKITFSSPEEDAKRRDFTINGMFYDPIRHKILDFVGGQEDLKSKTLRAIGDPQQRFEEDRLRMIRAIRFKVRFDFALDPLTEKAIMEKKNSLFPAVKVERIWAEFVKMSLFPRFGDGLWELYRVGLLSVIFPLLRDSIPSRMKEICHHLNRYSHLPTLYRLLPLFENKSDAEMVEAVSFLKISNRDLHRLELYCEARRLSFSTPSKTEWVHFYALEENLYALEAVSTLIHDEITFFQEHQKREAELSFYIEKKRSHTPLVSASDLMEEGLSPSKAIGILLKEGEQIAIEQNLKTQQEVLLQLKQSAFWPKGSS